MSMCCFHIFIQNLWLCTKKADAHSPLNKESLFLSCCAYFRTLFDTFRIICLRACCTLFFVASVSHHPNSNFKMKAFHIVFLQIWKQKLREVKQLVWGHTAMGGWGSDIWVHALKHPPVLLHPCKHNTAKLICKWMFCDLKGKSIFLMGKGEDDSWLISAEDLIISLPHLAQVHSESRLQQPRDAEEAKGQRRGTALSLESRWPACPLCHLELFPEGQQSLWYHQVLFSRQWG